jgi:hypothetical protein
MCFQTTAAWCLSMLVECGWEFWNVVDVAFIYSLQIDKDMAQPESKEKYVSVRNSVHLNERRLSTYTSRIKGHLS